MSRSYSRPKTSSSHFIARLSDCHAVLGLVEMLLGHEDLAASTSRPERVVKLSLRAARFAGHQREQVTGLGKGVLPDGEVASVRQVTALDQVAVGKQLRVALLVGLDTRPSSEPSRRAGRETR